MANRQYLTPPDIPDDVYCRVLRIPNSPQWIGTLTGVLYPLCFASAWTDEDGGITPEQAAERFTQIFNEMFSGTGDCDDMACCPLRINPYNGRLQQSNDGGLTWFDVADGPWVDSLYPPFSAMPQPRHELTDADKICAAAATAAYVLRNLYIQTGDTLLNVVAATDWEYASALGSMLSGFLLMIGAVATQPYVAIATLLGIVGVRQQYVDYPLDDDDEERLTCILLQHATLEPSGAVTFDFNGVWGAIDLDSPKNGLMRFLLTMIGPDALNYSGAVDAGLTVDCSPCGTWCRVIDFEVDDGGFVGSSYSWYESGVGWRSGVAPWNASAVRIDLDFADNLRITRLRYDYEIYGSWETGVGGAGLELSNTVVYSKSAPPTGIQNNVDSGGIGPITSDGTYFFMEGYPPTYGQIIVKKCTLWGEGNPPDFGVACLEDSELEG